VDTVKDSASTVAGAAGEEARAVARDAGAHAREVVGETKEQLRRQASEQTDRLSTSLRQMSDQIRGMGEGRAAPSGMVSDLTRQLADVTGNVAGRLESGGLDGALDEVKRFARRRPGVFLMAAAGTGFLVGRLLKAADTGSMIDAAKDAMSPDNGSRPSGEAAFAPTPTTAPTLGLESGATSGDLLLGSGE
jgi:hypothetical protein